MHIGVIGATGTIGSRVVAEALQRGHRVTAFSRDASAITDQRENLGWASVDVLDAASITAVLPGLDVLISGFQPGNAATDFADTVRRLDRGPDRLCGCRPGPAQGPGKPPPHPADRHRWRRRSGDRAGCRPRRPR
ncbi:NAD(P)-dependent oxidoreductase [Yinghuangia aomiensis]